MIAREVARSYKQYKCAVISRNLPIVIVSKSTTETRKPSRSMITKKGLTTVQKIFCNKPRLVIGDDGTYL